MTQETLADSQTVHAALQCLAGVSRSSRGAEAALAAGAGQCVVAVVQQVGCWVSWALPVTAAEPAAAQVGLRQPWQLSQASVW